MNALAGAADVERFRTAVARRLGLQFDDGKLGFLGEVLQRRLGRRSASDYLSSLEDQPPSDEIGALARELTVGETYFFRNNEQFRALADVALSERMRVERRPKVLRLLSAGCASGEEAYSIAIVARETIQDPSWDVAIRAVDLNPGALEKAEQARYSSWALRETPPDVRQRWFRAEGRETTLVEAARTAVQFEQKNLAVEDPELWRPAAYDVIFCRNVIMYFAPEAMHAVIARMAESLAPGGFLFLGHAETLRGLSDDFHLRHTHETFYYARKQNGERAVTRAIPAARLSSPSIAPEDAFSDAWVDAIRNATERVATLIPSAAAAEARPAAPPPAWDRAGTIDLLRRECFAEALVCVRRQQSPERDADPDKLLLEATLLAHASRIEAAEDVCRRLLSIDELNAGAHYVLALCREQAGDRDAAAEHDRVAIYLDPGFAMPRLHLGLLARRAGDHGSARRELGWALVLLKREDASRLLLFGGGFNRDALMALCEAALRSCGERS
ncbi:MAG: protein-glutamate O-methyltransferase CheR [Roseiarcus sp.]|jgi:chemotaxis protein methyltransferase CheR